ncbi:MAG: ATP-dependent helicase [Bacteroidota bacterium]|nr:ATP-dependent helicase [Bacteroidota bacterium]
MKKEMELSPKQKEIVDHDGLFVVKACPGSGKTFSVAARIARLLNYPHQDFNHRGIAALSFTNVAAEEIQEKLLNDFGIPTPIKYPHFVGTIDSFINRYIFLPHGHLIMECEQRPDLVGYPFTYWDEFDLSKRKKFPVNRGKLKCHRDPNEYFDKVTFNRNDDPIPKYYLEYFPISWKKIRKIDGSYIKQIQDIVNAKLFHFRNGKATQSDANYIAYKVLIKYKRIAKNLVNRFCHLIIDEAQDTNDVQMAIIDILKDEGLKEICLIGDPDQAIFEWNDAKPELFIRKHKEWAPIDFTENRRSSKLICDCTRQLFSIPEATYEVISCDKDYDFKPQVLGHNQDESSAQQVLETFKGICSERKIEMKPDKVAVLYRSHSTGEWFGISDPNKIDNPWSNGCYYVRDIAWGKYLMENEEIKKGFKTIERGYHKAIDKDLKHCSTDYIKKKIEESGFKEYRDKVFEFINLLPSTKNATLKQWIENANKVLHEKKYSIKLSVIQPKADIDFDKLFKISKEIKHPDYFIGTIHSAKGKTFEAVLVVLNKKPGKASYYSTMLPRDYSSLSSTDREELRNVYVAITRPKKILVIAVPQIDCDVWKQKLSLN